MLTVSRAVNRDKSNVSAFAQLESPPLVSKCHRLLVPGSNCYHNLVSHPQTLNGPLTTLPDTISFESLIDALII
jgi:hypothetical protein